jgi:hypothetical protein
MISNAVGDAHLRVIDNAESNVYDALNVVRRMNRE